MHVDIYWTRLWNVRGNNEEVLMMGHRRLLGMFIGLFLVGVLSVSTFGSEAPYVELSSHSQMYHYISVSEYNELMEYDRILRSCSEGNERYEEQIDCIKSLCFDSSIYCDLMLSRQIVAHSDVSFVDSNYQ